jgi:hypothetical protein
VYWITHSYLLRFSSNAGHFTGFLITAHQLPRLRVDLHCFAGQLWQQCGWPFKLGCHPTIPPMDICNKWLML